MGHKQLSQIERYQIFALRKEKFSIRQIAQNLGRSPSTISRELCRNQGLRGYRPLQAHHKARTRAKESRASNVSRIEPGTFAVVEALLKLQWSPQQISKRLSKDSDLRISHETIYRYVLKDRRNGGMLYLNLRRRHRKYQRRLGNTNARGQIKNRRSIETRPACIETRAHTGHWEGDTVVGRQKKGKVLVTLVERRSRFLVAKMASAKSAKEVAASIIEALQDSASMVKTVTFDNGKEFSNHQDIAKALDCDVYFARPYHSWERGTNENTNGLLRQYFPKGMSLDDVTDETLQTIVNRINKRPRRVLGYSTPEEIFVRAKNYQERKSRSHNLNPV